jgi:alpha/beta superfamily hydrolase
MTLHEIRGPAGRLEAILDKPAAPPRAADREPLDSAPRAAVVLGHPHPRHGGTMRSKVLHQAAKAFARIGCVVLRFNFRGTGLSEGSSGDGAGEQDDFRAALDAMHDRYRSAPLWAAGMSFGSWVGLTAGAADGRVTTLVGIAIPLSRDFTAVQQSQKAKFFIHGERDEITPLPRVRRFYADAAEPKELVVIDGADHVFDGHQMEVGDAIEDLLADWPR